MYSSFRLRGNLCSRFIEGRLGISREVIGIVARKHESLDSCEDWKSAQRNRNLDLVLEQSY
jgi:hypothetical protein